MSQVDKLNYVPLLIWFIVFFVFLYIVIFCKFLPLAYSILFVRTKFVQSVLLQTCQLINIVIRFAVMALNMIAPANVYCTLLLHSATPSWLNIHLINK